tara:strand:- start:1957 stop:2226 length:270 start_codon:yes stop_codon:yes gene_type:complete
MNKQEKIKSFNPNEPALNSNLFGLPFNEDECDIHVLPAAWEVTVSYGAGTMEGPKEIAIASAQVDLTMKDIQKDGNVGFGCMTLIKNGS